MTRQHAAHWRYVRMPATASTAVSEWMLAEGYNNPRGHTPARRCKRINPGDPHFGTIRNPVEWMRSVWGKLTDVGTGNQRAQRALLAYGDGCALWPDVFVGMCHPIPPPDLVEDPLFNPPGTGPLWTRSVRWHFGDGVDGWGVDALIPTWDLDRGLSDIFGRDVRIPRVNESIAARGLISRSELRWGLAANAEACDLVWERWRIRFGGEL